MTPQEKINREKEVKTLIVADSQARMVNQDSLNADVITPYNVGSVLWRLFSTLEVVQYIGG